MPWHRVRVGRPLLLSHGDRHDRRVARRRHRLALGDGGDGGPADTSHARKCSQGISRLDQAVEAIMGTRAVDGVARADALLASLACAVLRTRLGTRDAAIVSRAFSPISAAEVIAADRPVRDGLTVAAAPPGCVGPVVTPFRFATRCLARRLLRARVRVSASSTVSPDGSVASHWALARIGLWAMSEYWSIRRRLPQAVVAPTGCERFDTGQIRR